MGFVVHEEKDDKTSVQGVNDCHGMFFSFPVTVMDKGTLHATVRDGKNDIAEKLDSAGRKLSKKTPTN